MSKSIVLPAEQGIRGRARRRTQRHPRGAGAVPLDGGVPIISGGKLVGAIGVSGGTGQQDGQVAKAGADAIK
jgi:uncharacterized protein GlcG (DUF336 family)